MAHKKQAPKTDRTITLGAQSENSLLYPTNYVRTTKYTALTFLPLSLMLQFRRYANIYFLIVAILQSIPAISPLNPLSAIAPLVFVIALSMIREGYEDLKRYRSDLETNSKKTKRYCHSNKDWETDVEWKDLYVGDVIKIEGEDYIPADVVVLSSSNKNGSCFIMTSSLDGEKNLKPKFALKEIQSKIIEGNRFRLLGSLKYGPPNFDLYSFNGEIKMPESYGLGPKQLLLREAQLKNTEYVIGVVVYTGGDTKIMQNADEPRFKQSQIEALTNKLILIIIIVELILCLIIMIGSIVWNSRHGESYNYFIPKRYHSFTEGVLAFFTVFILLNTMIPISLIISLEMVKFTQAYFIDNDVDMRKDGLPSKTYNSSINEELGQIEYVFSDKTGTLTCNTMEFQCCFIGDSYFGDRNLLSEQQTNSLARQTTYRNEKAGVSFSFEDKNLRRLLEGEIRGKEERVVFKSSSGEQLYVIDDLQKLCENFFLVLSVDHDCMLEEKKGEDDSLNFNYQGPSPDEVALVDTAKHMGYVFKRTTNIGKIVEINGTDQEIEVLHFFEFSSKRKRSSIIIKHDGVIKILTKGADSIIIDRLSKTEDQIYLDKSNDLLQKFSLQGYRTLCYAMRVLSIKEWDDIESEIQSYNTHPDKKKKMESLADRVETNFMLLGCTAVEDKLQDNVPKVIADLIEANIKVWMLTGDKLETAENIGFSCKLIQPNFTKLYLRGNKKTEFGEKELKHEYDILLKKIQEKKAHEKYSLIVEGPVILNLTKYEMLARDYIWNIFSKCDSVVCCRMSPKQKGEIVRFVKKYQNKITLAIGDGANDVNMIQEAHIGIGLFGKEGMRAVQASDFALVEFQCLWKLLFVHGRWSYIRNSEMILYFYYKNIVFALPQFFFCFYNAFSGQTFFDDFYITFYNMAFTGLPVIARAIFDQDIYYKEYKTDLVNHNDLKKYYHHLYYVGQKNLIFEKKMIFLWILSGVITSIIIYFFGFTIGESFMINKYGHDINLWWISITIFTVIIFVVDIKILFFTKFFTVCSFLSVFIFSIVLYIIYFFVADFINVFYIYKTAKAICFSPIFYLTLILMIGAAIMFDLFILVIEREVRTPIYLLFKSLMERKLEEEKKEEIFKDIVYKIKDKIFEKGEIKEN